MRLSYWLLKLEHACVPATIVCGMKTNNRLCDWQDEDQRKDPARRRTSLKWCTSERERERKRERYPSLHSESSYKASFWSQGVQGLKLSYMKCSYSIQTSIQRYVCSIQTCYIAITRYNRLTSLWYTQVLSKNGGISSSCPGHKQTTQLIGSMDWINGARFHNSTLSVSVFPLLL